MRAAITLALVGSASCAFVLWACGGDDAAPSAAADGGGTNASSSSASSSGSSSSGSSSSTSSSSTSSGATPTDAGPIETCKVLSHELCDRACACAVDAGLNPPDCCIGTSTATQGGYCTYQLACPDNFERRLCGEAGAEALAVYACRAAEDNGACTPSNGSPKPFLKLPAECDELYRR